MPAPKYMRSRPKPGTVAYTVWAILDMQRKVDGEINRQDCFEITDQMGHKRETVKNAIYRYRDRYNLIDRE
jgi:uncharacterized protein YxjI